MKREISEDREVCICKSRAWNQSPAGIAVGAGRDKIRIHKCSGIKEIIHHGVAIGMVKLNCADGCARYKLCMLIAESAIESDVLSLQKGNGQPALNGLDCG
jgi:hypothetical protein